MTEHTKLSLKLPLELRLSNQVLGGYELKDQSDLTVVICLNKPCADWVLHRCNNFDQLLEAAKSVDMLYAQYMALRPDPTTESFDLIQGFVRQARAAIQAAEKD